MDEDLEYEILWNKSHTEATTILAATEYDKCSDNYDHEGIEKIFWHLLREYIEGRISEHTMSLICLDYEYDPTHHNMSQEAKIAMYECIKLEDLTFFRIDEIRADEIRENLKEDVSNYFGMWIKNFD